MYLCPERAKGDAMDNRGDLFCLGLVLHELLTGRRVLDQKNPAAVMNALMYLPMPTVRSRNPEVNAALDLTVLWALEREKDQRPASAEDWAKELKKACPQAEEWTPRRIANHFVTTRPRAVNQADTGSADWQAESITGGIGPRTARLHGRTKKGMPLWAAVAATAVVCAVGVKLATKPKPEAPPRIGSSTPTPAPDSPIPAALTVRTTPPPKPKLAARPRPAPPPKVLAPGSLTIDSRPVWSEVTVDGFHVGPTPLFRFSIAAGVHRVQLTNSEGKREDREVRVESGEETKVRIQW